MEHVAEFPHEVREIENEWIPLSDGTRLAAKIWLPDKVEKERVAAVLEYIPYRKRDNTSVRDSIMHRYFAGHGYASVRVDIRGSGDSEGVLTDEYLEQELKDGEEILKWIAEQEWCDGNIGMIGKSWGGFNGLQIAYRQPPELKAVITVCSTDDRYSDDVHYMGGCMLTDNLSWASNMFAINSTPPDPLIVGEDKWREMWKERLKGSGLWLETWLKHQHRDAYWKHGSVCEDFSRIQCPVMAVSGWADGYSNAVFRLMEALECPRKGLVGPWSHKYPHEGIPGPAIGFLQEAVRWWDHWLSGEENGIMEEPMLHMYLQDSVQPTTSYNFRPGRWVAEDEWPAPSVEWHSYPFGRNCLVGADEGEAIEDVQTLQSPLSVGLFAGKWCSYSATPDLPHDQREEDGGALVFTSEPLEEDIEIMGAPEVELEVSSSKPVAMIAVRLSDVAPDDKATRISYGLLNLTHRESHESPEPLEPEKSYRVRVRLNDIAQAFPKGHSLRVSISTSYWPLVWPPPKAVRLGIRTKVSKLQLPVRTGKGADERIRHFGRAVGAPPVRTRFLEPTHSNWWVKRDLANDESTLEVIKDDGVVHFEDIDLKVRQDTREWYSYKGLDMNSVRGEVYAIRGFERGDWKVSTYTRTILTSTENAFRVRAELDAYEGDTRIHSESWDRTIPRDLV